MDKKNCVEIKETNICGTENIELYLPTEDLRSS
jgi:hypothetical protein